MPSVLLSRALVDRWNKPLEEVPLDVFPGAELLAQQIARITAVLVDITRQCNHERCLQRSNEAFDSQGLFRLWLAFRDRLPIQELVGDRFPDAPPLYKNIG